MNKITVYVITCILLFAGFSAYALELKKAPLNPEFLEYLEQIKAGKARSKRTKTGPALGYRPGPIDLSHLKGQKITKALSHKALSPSYDLRAHGKLTSVKDQGNWGTCWAFATYGSLESCLLTSSSNDFSENNLVNEDGFDWGYDDGGTYYISSAYLARWKGPINESDDPYSNGEGGSPSGLTVQKHVQQILIIPDRGGSYTNNDDIKQAIVNYGAVGSSMYWKNSSSYYNSNYYAYYYGGTNSGNHAIAIVGWDDNFSRFNFPSTPSGNGAFLIRNSWGTSFGDSGYFYISYYDKRIGKVNFVFNNAESTSNYDTNYQYDPFGWVSSVGLGSTTAWGANVFSATADSTLKAVSFYAVSASTSYEIYIYTGVSSGNPRSGTLQSNQSGTLSFPGYHTITLSSPVSLSSGSSFSVVIKFTTPGCNFPIPIEYAVAGYCSSATASAGQSYASSEGSSPWYDLTTDVDSTANNCIKAFATSSSPSPTPNPYAYYAYVYAYYGHEYAKWIYEHYYDYQNILRNGYVYSYYGLYYASYAYLYDSLYGDDQGFAYLAYVYDYYGYLYGYNAYSLGLSYSYYVMAYDYYASCYSYLVHIGQRSNQELSDLGQPMLDQELPDLDPQVLNQLLLDME